jgi:hypothetical protein
LSRCQALMSPFSIYFRVHLRVWPPAAADADTCSCMECSAQCRQIVGFVGGPRGALQVTPVISLSLGVLSTAVGKTNLGLVTVRPVEGTWQKLRLEDQRPPCYLAEGLRHGPSGTMPSSPGLGYRHLMTDVSAFGEIHTRLANFLSMHALVDLEGPSHRPGHAQVSGHDDDPVLSEGQVPFLRRLLSTELRSSQGLSRRSSCSVRQL